MTIAGPVPPKVAGVQPPPNSLVVAPPALVRRSASGQWGFALAAAGLAVAVLAWYTWSRADAGPKLYYIHVPSAVTTLLGCAVVFISSLGYLWTRNEKWDRAALASARVSVLLCSLLLVTGMLWARQAWGAWWVWSPRLTFSLILWVLYAAYLVLRQITGSGERGRVIAALYGIVAFLDVPLVYLSVKLLPDIHPETVQLRPQMQSLVLAWIGGMVLAGAALIGFWCAWLGRAGAENPGKSP